MRLILTRALRALLMLACCGVGFGLVVVTLHVPLVALLVAFGVLWQRARRPVLSGWSHGSARLANLSDASRCGMLSDDGLILGTTALMSRPSYKDGLFALFSPRVPSKQACCLFLEAISKSRRVGERMLRIGQFTHLATFAPTGRGKGVSVVIPNLLSYPHSCVVTDPKGELYEETSDHRRRHFGHRIIRLDPSGICGPGSDTVNPLDFIDDKAEEFLDQCRDQADMLIMQSGKEPDPYWNDAARSVITAFIAFVCACEEQPEKRNLDTVRELLSSRDTYGKAIEIMQQVESHGGVIQRLGHSLTWHVDRELGSVLANVQRHMEFLDSPVIRRSIARSSFDPMCLRTGRASIYLCLSHDKLDTLAPMMRMWVGVILRTITRGRPSEKNPVLFILDEAAHLGKIRVLEQAVTLMRGMGIRLWFIFQSIHQLSDCFGEKARTILDNIDTQQYFSLNEYDNAESVSKRIGDTTIAVTSHGKNAGSSWQSAEQGRQTSGRSDGWNTTVSETGRRVLRPEELMTLPEDVALVFHRNSPAIPVRLLKYYQHPAFRGGGTGDQPWGLGLAALGNAVCFIILGVVFGFCGFELSPFKSGLFPRLRLCCTEGAVPA